MPCADYLRAAIDAAKILSINPLISFAGGFLVCYLHYGVRVGSPPTYFSS